MFSEYLQALKEGHIIERCLDAYNEMRQYQTGPRTVFHVGAENTDDPTQAKEQHGDRVVARCVAWRALQGIGYVGPKALPEDVEPGLDADERWGTMPWFRSRFAARDKTKGRRPRYSENRV